VVTQSFNEASEVDRYDRFLRAVVDLVVKKYDGTLKAEHGTGRNIAPFVETEWGGDAYRIMKRLKACIDPQNLLNPGVIINSDKNLHIKNLKELPSVEEEVDRCIECGYCEHKCPSRDITTTPRRRIILRRELQRLKQRNDIATYKEVLRDYQYDGLDTCAVDGLCATACPVDINTGDLVKRLRRENHSSFQNRVALSVAKNFRTTEALVRTGIGAGMLVNRLFGAAAMRRLTGAMKKIITAFPQWSDHISGSPSLPKTHTGNMGQIVYFPTCITRVMGTGVNGKKDLMQTFVSVCRKAGIGVVIPGNIKGSCCGQIFSSKGFAAAYKFKVNDIVERLWQSSRGGELRIVTDVSSCAYTLRQIRPALTDENKKRYDGMMIMDSVEFLHDVIMPAVRPATKKESVVLHPVCSLEKMGTVKKFVALANYFSNEAVVPLNSGCCGMAGDRGFLFPELTASATRPEASEVLATRPAAEGYYSSTKTCEMAMTDAVRANYESILYLVDETT
jgi:D-lactate dehydrogenase